MKKSEPTRAGNPNLAQQTRGRKPRFGVAMKNRVIRLSDEHHAKFLALGGPDWLRAKLDAE